MTRRLLLPSIVSRVPGQSKKAPNSRESPARSRQSRLTKLASHSVMMSSLRILWCYMLARNDCSRAGIAEPRENRRRVRIIELHEPALGHRLIEPERRGWHCPARLSSHVMTGALFFIDNIWLNNCYLSQFGNSLLCIIKSSRRVFETNRRVLRCFFVNFILIILTLQVTFNVVDFKKCDGRLGLTM